MTGNKGIGILGGASCGSGPRRNNSSTNTYALGGVFCVNEGGSGTTWEDNQAVVVPVSTANIANGHMVVVLNKDIAAGDTGPLADGDDVIVDALVYGSVSKNDLLKCVNAQNYLAKATTNDSKVHGRALENQTNTSALLSKVRFWSEGKYRF